MSKSWQTKLAICLEKFVVSASWRNLLEKKLRLSNLLKMQEVIVFSMGWFLNLLLRQF